MARKILITGRPGVGKTTVVRKALAGGLAVAGGFYTAEIRRGGCRLGFRVEDIHTGSAATLSHVDRKGRPRVGKYGVDVAGFDRVGVAALRAALGREGCLVVDEIGKMELCSPAFREAVTAVMDSGRDVLATIPVHRHPFLDALRARPDAELIEVTSSNRSALPHRLLEMFRRGG